MIDELGFMLIFSVLAVVVIILYAIAIIKEE